MNSKITPQNSRNGSTGEAALSRRQKPKLAAARALALGPSLAAGAKETEKMGDYYKAKNGRINQSVIYWCFKPIPVPELAAYAARMGMKSVELVTPEFWPMLKEH